MLSSGTDNRDASDRVLGGYRVLSARSPLANRENSFACISHRCEYVQLVAGKAYVRASNSRCVDIIGDTARILLDPSYFSRSSTPVTSGRGLTSNSISRISYLSRGESSADVAQKIARFDRKKGNEINDRCVTARKM